MGTRIRNKIVKDAVVLLMLFLSVKVDCLTIGERINRDRIRGTNQQQFQPLRSGKQTKTIPGINMSPTMGELEREIVRLGRRGNTDEALNLYHSISRPSLRVLNGAIDACSRARPTRLEQAFDLLKEGTNLKKLKPNVFTFGSLMSACARARKADRAIKLLRSMEKSYGVCPNAVVYSSAISACSRAAIYEPLKHRTALELLSEAEEKGLQMSVVGYNTALGACSNAAEFEAAMVLFERMKSCGIVDQVSYGTVMAACEKGEQWGQVLKYAHLMRDENIEMDGIAVMSALHACQRKGLAEDAIYYLNMMKQSPKQPQQRKTAGWKREGARGALKGPDNVAYRLAISACARGGDWENGITLLDEMKEVTGKADVIAYTAAITGCEYAGEWQHAFSLLETMRRDKVDPNEVTMAAVISACATGCAKGNDSTSAFRKAIQLLMAMKKDPTVVDPDIKVYNTAIRTCAEAGKVDAAFKLLEDAENNELEPNIVTFGTLMTACERTESVDGMRKVFELMAGRDISPNEIVYGAAISCLRKASLSGRTLFLLRKMIQGNLKPNIATFNTVLISQTEGAYGTLENALETYKLMKASDHVKPNRQSYGILIKACNWNKQPNGAEAFIHLMRQNGFKPDVDLYTMTVTAYEKAGNPLRALRLMECMEEDGYDYYSIAPLNTAFKNVVKVVNAVGNRFTDEYDDEQDTWKSKIY